MKQFSVSFSFIFLFVSLQSHLVFAANFSTPDKKIRMEVIDYRDFLDDIIFWIHQEQATPVVSQTLVNNGIYPISVTIYNDGDKSIKIVKNAIGGLSTAQEHEVAQLYHYDTIARVAKQAIFGAAAVFVTIELLNILSGFKLDPALEQYGQSWYRKFQCASASVCGIFAGVIHWPAVATANTLISQAFQSQTLSEESIIAPGCSLSFLLFASHTPHGYTLKVPILDEQDNQVISFECPFGVVTAS